MFKEIKLTKRDLNKANKFADLRCAEDQHLYKKRGAFKREDIINGALAEIGVYKLLVENGFNPSKPDFTLHGKEDKSFDADLRLKDYHIHVKGQSMDSVQKYGKSWIMQRYDPIIITPKQKHFLAPCVVDSNKMTCYVHGIIPIRTLADRHCFGECVVPSFRRTKVALYHDFMESVLTYNSYWGILYRRKVNE